MSWGDTDVVDDQTRAPSMTDGVVMLRPLATNDAPAWLAGRTKSNDDGSKLLDLRNSTMFKGSSPSVKRRGE